MTLSGTPSTAKRRQAHRRVGGRDALIDQAGRANAVSLAAMGDASIAWVVATVPPGRELAALAEVTRRGYYGYVMLEHVFRQPNRFANYRKRYTKPLLSQMVFVGCRPPHERVFELFAGRLARSADDRPGALLGLTGSALREFVLAHAPDDITRYVERRAAFEIGWGVTLTGGPLRGQRGVVSDVGRRTVTVELDILGRATSVTARPQHVERWGGG